MTQNDFANRPAPADAKAHRHWSLRRKVLTYLLLTASAALSIWYIDRQVRQVGSERVLMKPASAPSASPMVK